MKVIVPCAGKSSRFPNMRPKYMLTHPDGNLMIEKAIDKLKGVEKKDIIITILKEHDKKYDIVRGIKENIGKEVKIIILDKPTKSQPETIYKTLLHSKLDEPFLVKDSDNMFSVDVGADYNYVCYSNLQEFPEINAVNKSYIVMNDQGIIVEIVEKKVVSHSFSVGGYFFKNPKKFIETYEKINKKNPSELYVSHIIEDMILNSKEIFLGQKVENYHDWGTLEAWFKYRQKFKTYIFDIDGLFFKNAAQYTIPRWEDASFLKKNMQLLRELSNNPYIQLFFLTSKPESYRKMVEDRLAKWKIKYDALTMGCQHAKRIIVNDFSTTTGYPSCEAINIPRDSEDLEKYL